MNSQTPRAAMPARSEPVFQRLPLPRFVLRHVVLRNGLTVGTRLLVVGRGATELADFFAYLGLRARAGGFVDSDRVADQVQLRLTDSDAMPAEASVDCVLATDGLACTDPQLRLGRSGADLPALLAACLTCLSPRGRLLVVESVRGGVARGVSHRAECLTRHLEPIPGATHVDLLGTRPPWRRWLPATFGGSPLRLVGHTLPPQESAPPQESTAEGGPQKWLDVLRDCGAVCRCVESGPQQLGRAA